MAEACYLLKRVAFEGRVVPILLQDENGPCPLIAIANILLLQNRVQLPAEAGEIAASRVIQLVAGVLLDDNQSDKVDPSVRADLEKNIVDAISLLPKLQTGIDVNVRFKDTKGFEFTDEIAIFDLLNISLVHGWLYDQMDRQQAALIGDMSYNEAVMKIVTVLDGANGGFTPLGGGKGRAFAAALASEAERARGSAAEPRSGDAPVQKSARDLASLAPREAQALSQMLSQALSAQLGTTGSSLSLSLADQSERVSSSRSLTNSMTPTINRLLSDLVRTNFLPAELAAGAAAAQEAAASRAEQGSFKVPRPRSLSLLAPFARIDEDRPLGDALLEPSVTERSPFEPQALAQVGGEAAQEDVDEAGQGNAEEAGQRNAKEAGQRNAKEAGQGNAEEQDSLSPGAATASPASGPATASRSPALATLPEASAQLSGSTVGSLARPMPLTPASSLAVPDAIPSGPLAGISASLLAAALHLARRSSSEVEAAEGAGVKKALSRISPPATMTPHPSLTVGALQTVSSPELAESLAAALAAMNWGAEGEKGRWEGRRGDDPTSPAETSSSSSTHASHRSHALAHARAAGPTSPSSMVSAFSANSCRPLSPATSEAEVSRALAVREFMAEHSSQLTFTGLLRLQHDLREGQFAVFFRNNHFGALLKRGGALYLLVADQGYAHEADVVWEHLCSVGGDTAFVNAAFKPFVPHVEPADPRQGGGAPERGTGAAAAASPGSPDLDADLALALALHHEEQERAEEERDRRRQAAQRVGEEDQRGGDWRGEDRRGEDRRGGDRRAAPAEQAPERGRQAAASPRRDALARRPARRKDQNCVLM